MILSRGNRDVHSGPEQSVDSEIGDPLMSNPTKWSNLLSADDGATMVEYALLLLFIVFVTVSVVSLMGGLTTGLLSVRDALE